MNKTIMFPAGQMIDQVLIVSSLQKTIIEELQKVEQFQNFPAEVSVFIDSLGSPVNLAPFVDAKSDRISRITELNHLLQITVYFGFSKWDDKSSAIYNFDAETGRCFLNEELTKWQKESHKQVLETANQLAEETCKLILLKARNEINTLKTWAKICDQ